MDKVRINTTFPLSFTKRIRCNNWINVIHGDIKILNKNDLFAQIGTT